MVRDKLGIFNYAELQNIFPFYIEVNSDLKIISFGKSLKKFAQIKLQDNFITHFEIKKPSLQFIDASEIYAYHHNLLILMELKKQQLFRGQIINSLNNTYFFLITPWFNNIEELNLLKLGFDDFALNDPTIDLLNLIKTNENNTEDLRQLAYELRMQRHEIKNLSWVVENANNAIITVSPNKKIEFINRAAELLFNINIKEIEGKYFIYVLNQISNNVSFNDEIIGKIFCRNPFEEEIEFILENQNTLYLKISSKPFYNEFGRLINYYIILENITTQKLNENTIKTQYTRLNTLISNLHEAIIFEDKQRKIALTNESFCNLFNIPVKPDELIGFDCEEALLEAKKIFIDPEYFIASTEFILKNNVTKLAEEFELTNGKILERDFIPIIIDNDFVGCLWKYRDVTVRVKNERKTEANKAFYERILNEIPADIAIFSVDHKYLFVNKAGIKDEKVRRWIIGKNDFDYVKFRNKDIKIAEQRRIYFEETIKSGETVSWVDEYTDVNNNKSYLLRKFYPFKNNENEIDLVIGYGIDITQQKLYEEEIKWEKEGLNILLQSLNDGILKIYIDGQINYFNGAFNKMLQSHSLEIIDESIYSILEKNEKQYFQNVVRKLLETQQAQRGLIKRENSKTNKTDYFEVFLTLSSRKLDEKLIIIRLSDVTESYLREKDLELIVQKEKKLNLLKTKFVSITSHEIRTPLSVILSSAELIEMESEAKDIFKRGENKYINRIIFESNRIVDILNQLLMVSKMENGQMEFKPNYVNFKFIIEEIYSEFYNPYIDGRTLKIVDNTTLNNLLLDKILFRLALLNILNNAFKYSRNKQPPILIISECDKYVEFAIEDFGIGIPPEEIENISNSFYRGSNVGNISGTGIGLMFVDIVIKRHHGKLNFNSVLNEGTVFILKFPKQIDYND